MHVHHKLARFSVEVLRRFQQERGLQLASSLTFTTLLALVPLLTVTLTIASAFPAFSGLTGQVDDFIAAHVLPEQIGKTVLRYMDQFSQRAGRLTIIGLGFLGLTAFLTMLTIERAFNLIWHTPSRRPFLQRLVVYWAILTLGPILIGIGVTMTSYVVTTSLGLVRGVPYLSLTLLWLLPFVLTISAFTLLYFVVPSKPVSIRHAAIGGVVAGVLFELAKRCFAIYVSQVPTYALVYGTFAAVPIFLFWIYLSWLVTVLGAVVTASLPEFNFLGRGEAGAGDGFVEILKVLCAVADSQFRKGAVTVEEIAAGAGLRVERCEEALNQLAVHGWVGKIEGGNWALVCSPANIRLLDVVRRFLVDPRAVGATLPPGPVSFSLDGLDRCLQGLDGTSIQDALQGNGGASSKAAPVGT